MTVSERRHVVYIYSLNVEEVGALECLGNFETKVYLKEDNLDRCFKFASITSDH